MKCSNRRKLPSVPSGISAVWSPRALMASFFEVGMVVVRARADTSACHATRAPGATGDGHKLPPATPPIAYGRCRSRCASATPRAAPRPDPGGGAPGLLRAARRRPLAPDATGAGHNRDPPTRPGAYGHRRAPGHPWGREWAAHRRPGAPRDASGRRRGGAARAERVERDRRAAQPIGLDETRRMSRVPVTAAAAGRVGAGAKVENRRLDACGADGAPDRPTNAPSVTGSGTDQRGARRRVG